MPKQRTDSKTDERVMLRSGPLARELGVSASLLNHWAKQGHIPPAERDPQGVRVWDRAKVVSAVQTGWRGLRAGGYGGPAPARPRSERARARERDRLDALITRVAARAADRAVKSWLTKLVERGNRASGSVAGPEREKKQRA